MEFVYLSFIFSKKAKKKQLKSNFTVKYNGFDFNNGEYIDD